MNFSNDPILMQTRDLTKAKGVLIGHIHRGEFLGYTKELDLAKPGFYFIADQGLVIHKSYVARQRSRNGFKSTLSNIRNMRTDPTMKLHNRSRMATLTVHFVEYDQMKSLLNPDSGKVKLLFTKMYMDEFQNYEEVYQLLNDLYTFKTQPTRS